MEYKKGNGFVGFIVAVFIIFIIGIIILSSKQSSEEKPVNEIQLQNQIQDDLVQAVPVPDINTSVERVNIARRAEVFDAEDKITYIYLINYGRVMAFYTVDGKVSSLRSYMTPMEKLVKSDGTPCTKYTSAGNCYIVEAPDIDGAYGDNADGVFFFTTEGAYVEWKGDYMMSDQPLKLTQQPVLVREIE